MPPIRSARNRKPPPDGFDDLEDTLLEFSNKMKDAENASHEGKKRHEVIWPIFQITHQRAYLILCLSLHFSIVFSQRRKLRGSADADSSVGMGFRVTVHIRTLLRERGNL